MESSDVVAGDAALATDYNNLRQDLIGMVVTGGAGGVSQYDAVYMHTNGKVLPADIGSLSEARVIGIMTEAVAEDATGTMQMRGDISNPGWSFSTIGGDVFLSGSGNISQTAPTYGSGDFLVKVGWALNATTLVINIGEPTQI